MEPCKRRLKHSFICLLIPVFVLEKKNAMECRLVAHHVLLLTWHSFARCDLISPQIWWIAPIPSCHVCMQNFCCLTGTFHVCFLLMSIKFMNPVFDHIWSCFPVGLISNLLPWFRILFLNLHKFICPFASEYVFPLDDIMFYHVEWTYVCLLSSLFFCEPLYFCL